MPRRSKDDAELRMSIGVMRVAAKQGKTPAEAVELVREHLKNLNDLNNFRSFTSHEIDKSQISAKEAK